MSEPLITTPDGRPLTELSHDELLDVIRAQHQAGIRIQFPGKDVARSLTRRVRPRVSRTIAKYTIGHPQDQANNMVMEADNLQGMVTLYRYRGHVDLILTDPPYNTGNDWRYNDKWDIDPNDPGLGDWVGPDDVGRHTKWMRFMYPRLQMMRAMLKPAGVLAVCIDHRELFRLGQMLDELFGEENRLAIINWQKSYAPRNDNKHVSTATEYILVYARDVDYARTALLPRTDAHNVRYANVDDDPDGVWREHDLSAATPSGPSQYGIQSPLTGHVYYPPGVRSWTHPKRNIKRWLEEWSLQYEERSIGDGRAPALMVIGATPDNIPDELSQKAWMRYKAGKWPFIWFGLTGKGGPRVKRYFNRVKKGIVPMTYWADEDYDQPLAFGASSWDHEQSGRSQTGIKELNAIIGSGHGFETVKPLQLFEKVIQLWCPPNGLVLDPFAGSGTTGHAVMSLNMIAGAARRFVLIEQGRPERGDSYARTLLAERLRRVITGDWAEVRASPVPGGFRFVQLHKKVDAETVLRMERDEMLDTVIASHYDSNRRRGPSLVSLAEDGHRYLIAKNTEDEGFFLVWGGPEENTDFTEEVYETVAAEALKAGLAHTYHVYARLYVFQTENVRFYQIPDRILADFGLNIAGEPFYEDTN